MISLSFLEINYNKLLIIINTLLSIHSFFIIENNGYFHNIKIEGYDNNYSPVTLQGDGNYIYSRKNLEYNVVSKKELTVEWEKCLNITNNQTLKFQNLIDLPEINLLFYYTNCSKISLGKNEGISFSLSFNNEDASLVHTLKKKNLIEDLVFAYSFHKSPIISLYVGGIDNSLINNVNSFECKPQNNKWGCQLDYIYFDEQFNISFKNNYSVIFEAPGIHSNVPNDFLNFIKNTFLLQEFKNRECYFNSESFNGNYIFCEGNIMNKGIPHYIYLNFNGNIVKLDFFKFVHKTVSTSWITLTSSFKKSEKDTWILGDQFLSYFNVSLFDFNKKTITFYSNELIVHSNQINKKFSTKIIILINFSLLFFGIIISLFKNEQIRKMLI